MSFARMTSTGALVVLTALSVAALAAMQDSAESQEGAQDIEDILSVETVETDSTPQEGAESEESMESEEWTPSLTPDGQPDIQGIWAPGSGGGTLFLEPIGYLMSMGMPPPQLGTSLLAVSGPPPVNIAEGGPPPLNQGTIIDPEDQIIPYQPWAKERRNEVLLTYGDPNPAQVDTQTRAWPLGVPRANIYSSHDGSIGAPIQILQPPGHVVFLYEVGHEFRVVPLGDRPHPGEDIKLWMGDSRGRWEGNTLVIDVTNHNDSTRLTIPGDFHSDEMRVTEEWTFFDENRIEYRATIEDPQVYTRPWTIGMTLTRGQPGTELLEYAGVEGDLSEMMLPSGS